MRLCVDEDLLLILMKDGRYFEVNCKSASEAVNLKGVIELGIADTIEQLQIEAENGQPL